MRRGADYTLQIDTSGQRYLVIPEELARRALAALQSQELNPDLGAAEQSPEQAITSIPELDAPDLGRRLAEARVAKGLKAKEVAAALNLSPVTISKIERGINPPSSVNYVKLIKLLFGVEILPARLSRRQNTKKT